MKAITTEWVTKAENDFSTLERESAVSQHPNYDIICFLAQQCAEKYLKARLSESEISFPKIHDLFELLDRTIDLEPNWENFREPLVFLTQYAVNVRYPGYSATKEDADKAYEYCQKFRLAARESIGLKP